jgi:hypothetical protein
MILFDAFSSREPVTATLENALVHADEYAALLSHIQLSWKGISP